MNLWNSLEELRARQDVLRHPFYVRWSAGELSRAELAGYAGQYRHAVVALAAAAANAAAGAAESEGELRATLDEHAAEEAGHVALWDDFCRAVGGSSAAVPTAETAACARAWAGDGGRPLLRSLGALYAIEAGQPAIAAAKRTGLTAHYGVQEGPATAYFQLHERLDVEHAASSRELIERRLRGGREGGALPERAPGDTAEADEWAVLDEAGAVLRANWLLLDGVQRLAGVGG